MARMATQVSGTDYGDQQQWSEEDKLAYNAKWDVLRKAIAGKMGQLRVGMIRRLPVIVTEITDPMTVPNTHPSAAPGAMRTIRKLYLEVAIPGAEGIRFIMDTADNVQNEKTKLHALYIAVHGEVPPRWGRFNYDLDELIRKPVMGEFLYKGTREDGKRGGMNLKLQGIEMYDGETEFSHPLIGVSVEEVPAPVTPQQGVANAPANPSPTQESAPTVAAKNTASPTPPASSSDDEDDEEIPF